MSKRAIILGKNQIHFIFRMIVNSLWVILFKSSFNYQVRMNNETFIKQKSQI